MADLDKAATFLLCTFKTQRALDLLRLLSGDCERTATSDPPRAVYAWLMAAVRADILTYFLPAHSEAAAGRYVFGYTVRLSNSSDLAVRLLRRCWTLTDSLGRTQTLRGKGIAGEQPLVLPDGVFEYSSVHTLTTPSGFLEGVFDLEDETKTPLTVELPRVALEQPGL